MENDVSKVMTQPEKIDYILSGAAKYFGRKEEELYSPEKKTARFGSEKKLIALILSQHTSLKAWEIAQRLGFRAKCTVYAHCRDAKEELSDNNYGFEKSKLLYKELMSYLNL